MEKNKYRLHEIWQKYLAGTATAGELEQLLAKLEQQDRIVLEQLFQQDLEGEEQMPEEMAAHMRQQLEKATTEEKVKVYPLPRMGRIAAVAAIFLLLIAGSYYVLRQQNKQQAGALAETAYDSVANFSKAARFVQLPDDTKVWLNKGAVLYISKTFLQQRQVRLTGEAYFDVVKNAASPLVVQTANITTTVLGTGFNVYNSGSAVRISLLQGRVQVSKSGQVPAPVLLSPGETALADTGTAAITNSKTGVTDVTAWIKGHLVFNQVPLAEALEKAGDYYGITIKADKALLQGKIVNTIYYKQQNWQQVLHHLLFIYRLTYSTNSSNEIVIRKQ
jgi:ferric-dicitrate binding protein FerR (iron transport regulator)